jgi:hypothetical protein
MQIYGIDFTSAPKPRKQLTVASCSLDGEQLHVEAFERLERFEDLASLLARPGPWVAGLDFPFGQPQQLIDDLGWPPAWEGYVEQAANITLAEFTEALAAFRARQPPGQKQPPRATDLPAGSRSAMMLFGVPVGKMFFRGAPILMRAGVSVLPCRPRPESRVALEIYPRLVANKWVGRASYKHEQRRLQTTARLAARQAILAGVCGERPALDGRSVEAWYSCAARLSTDLADACLNDASGDTLDGLLAAIQAAWATTRPSYGIPEGHALEGWIVDPEMVDQRTGRRRTTELQNYRATEPPSRRDRRVL